MFDTSGTLQSIYTAEVTERDDAYIIEIPDRELELGAIDPEDIVQVALFTSSDTSASRADTHSETDNSRQTSNEQEQRADDPPVSEGETLEVTIESVGEQGDGVAKVDRGYVLIIPGTKPGEQPVVKVETVKKKRRIRRSRRLGRTPRLKTGSRHSYRAITHVIRLPTHSGTSVITESRPRRPVRSCHW